MRARVHEHTCRTPAYLAACFSLSQERSRKNRDTVRVGLRLEENY